MVKACAQAMTMMQKMTINATMSLPALVIVRFTSQIRIQYCLAYLVTLIRVRNALIPTAQWKKLAHLLVRVDVHRRQAKTEKANERG